MSLVRVATLSVTDSGGVQEETTYLGIPCLTVRESTERPITVDEGSNRLIKADQLEPAVATVLSGAWPKGRRPALRSEAHKSELQSLMRISYAVFCLKKQIYTHQIPQTISHSTLH